MSKRMTRVLSLILTLVMFVSVSTPAFAWGGGDVGSGWGREIGEDDFRDFTPADEVEEEKEEYDYFQTDGAEGFQVTVEAPMGSLPTMAELRAEPVEIEDVREAVESVVEGEANILVAMDISFWMNGVEIEPEEAVRVKISAPELTGKTNLTVVHIPDAEEPETVDLLDEGELSFALGANEVAFRADSFSVYAVIGDGTGEEDRVAVNFYGKDKQLVTTYYVKNGDQLLGEGTPVDGKTYLEDFIVDPGVGGQLDEDYVFLGWTIDAEDANSDENYDTENYGANYSAGTKPYTIDGVRSYLQELANDPEHPIQEGSQPVNIYALIFKVIRVSFQAPNGISMGDERQLLLPGQTELQYTIETVYTPDKQDAMFKGWYVKAGSVSSATLDGEPAEEPYQVGTVVTLEHSVTFIAVAPEGKWLVFDEVIKGATYNAPQFIEPDENEQYIPTEPDESNMKLLGYTFGGWYTSKDYTTPFDFTQSLTASPTYAYAKWNPKENADYTILIWKQNVDGETYDFAESVTLNGTVGSNISTVTESGSGNARYALVNGEARRYDGFHLDRYDQNVKIKTEGSSVLNVYYNRNEITITFYQFETLTPYTYSFWTYDIRGKYYGFVDGRYRNIEFLGGWLYLGGIYTGTVYHATSPFRWRPWKTVKGLYGQSLEAGTVVGSNEQFKWPSQYYWYDSHEDNDSPNIGTGVLRTTFMDAFLPSVPTDTEMSFYGCIPTNDSGHVYFYKGDYTNYDQDVQVSSGSTFNISDKYNGYKAIAYSNNNRDWTPLGEKDSNGYYGSATPNPNLYIRYEPLKYNLLYQDGMYVDGNGNPVEGYSSRGKLDEVKDIPYASDMSSYNKGEGGTNYYEPEGVDGFVFEGWFSDDKCTQAYTFNTMPEGLTLYAKWRQIQYRVFLHPNVPVGDDLDWGSSTVSMNFRVSVGEKVSLPTGLREDYNLIGWYSDEACTQPFNGNMRLTDSITKDYDKTAEENWTDGIDGKDMTKYGTIDGEGYNSDAYKRNDDGSLTAIDRFWITRKLDLYAKWSAKLDGAKGIDVIYEAGDDGDPNTVPRDSNDYMDNASAVAGAAASPKASTDENAPKMKFQYWQLQTWNGTDYVPKEGYKILPGEEFTVLKADAREEDIPEAEQVIPGVVKTFTVKLVAVFAPEEEPKTTTITWYSNVQDAEGRSLALAGFGITDQEPVDGKGYFVTDEDLPINGATAIKAADTFSYSSYKFIGWAKKANATKDELFLKWEDGKYLALNENDAWVEVTEVAANDLESNEVFAIWETGYFYIYHSSNNTVEKISALNVVDGKYDLAAKTAANCLYGGYYSEYGGVGAGFDPTKLTGNGPFDDANGTPYSLEKIETALQADHSSSLWDYKKAYTENGHAMTPKADTVYYLKEVPDGYLKPYTQYTYYTLPAKADMLGTVWCVLGVDDLNYQSAGFSIEAVTKDGDKTAIMRDVLHFWPESNEDLKVELTCKGLYGGAGFLGYAELNEFAADSNGLFSETATIRQYWKTMDGVTVYGTTQRVLSFGNGKYTSLTAEDSAFPAPAEP